MTNPEIYIGNTKLNSPELKVNGGFIDLDGERYYRIANYDRMPPFLMSIVSSSDQWIFISSNGALTAGRKNPGGAIFPYYSEDKIHDYQGKTGSRTIILVKRSEKSHLWEPFADSYPSVYSIHRNIYKNLYGNKLIFQEINDDLSLTFQYGWFNSDQFGFVKNSILINHDSSALKVDVLDGIQNILPFGVDHNLQIGFSNLLDAYKKSELITEIGLGIFRLSSIPIDTAEPSEALKVNTVWSEGLENTNTLLSNRQLDLFKRGFPVETEKEIKATKGAYFVHAQLDLSPGEEKEWNLVAEVDQDAADVAALMSMLRNKENIRQLLFDDIDRSTENLIRIIASSDGIQHTRDELSTSHHLSNVLFNVMRGGLFEQNYNIQTSDFLSFIANANIKILENAVSLVASSGEFIHHAELLNRSWAQDNPDLIRLSYEYLPVSFSRRHGDPSRPWNLFSIETKNEDGTKNFSYQGNWRDIFQNWEALSLSFPGFVESMICKFVNASTPDGYNPYRITRNGIDWEKPDPSDPWSNIGYWGDHQIIYLLKFLEISVQHHPQLLRDFLSKEIFSYANVPYRIKPYRDLVKDPHNTIEFDSKLDGKIDGRVVTTGTDGKLVWKDEGDVLHVNLGEKLLVTMLVKISNFIPGAGIWMNTQRPEWNDANNALVGYGVSMVTTFYLRRFIHFCTNLFASAEPDSLTLSEEVANFLEEISWILTMPEYLGENTFSSQGRRKMMDALGKAGSDYRQCLYDKGLSGRNKQLSLAAVLEFFKNSLHHLDLTIKGNKRKDGLYHSYNLIKFESHDNVEIRHLYEMLEGQVAAIGSGILTAGEVVEVLDALRSSALFRKDQYSYILYPDRKLPAFTENNNIPAAMLEGSALLIKLTESGNKQIVVKDINGDYHFNGNFRNIQHLKNALGELPEEFSEIVKEEIQLVLDIFENVFDHQSFTGRSGTFFGYEGLGSIYWHMVSKLLLAVCEAYFRASHDNVNNKILEMLAKHYYDIRAGIGLNKSPDEYGAFPTDPYSHTPGNRGAQQPGLTGQVKEDVISRWGELGVVIRAGRLSFQPILLRKEEFLSVPGIFTYHDVHGKSKEIHLEQNNLAFTYCQVPIVYRFSAENKVVIRSYLGEEQLITGNTIDGLTSESIFRRDGKIARIDVWLNRTLTGGL